MKMVAAAKLRKAQTRMLEMRPYADKMQSVISSLATGMTAEQDAHPLLVARPRKVAEVLVITSDRGLCGAFNTNVIRAANRLVAEINGELPDEQISAERVEVSLSIVGKKARDYYKRRNYNIRKAWTGLSGGLTFADAQAVAKDVIDSYIEGTVDEVYVVYNEFKNVVQQVVRSSKLLPTVAEAEEGEEGQMADFIYEPSEEQLLDALLPKNVEIQIFRALLEAQASEEAARMSAMENATKSANEMIERLTLQFNKARQAAITAELMDIVGGVEALKAS